MVGEECRVALFQDYLTTCGKIIVESYAKTHGVDMKLPSFIEMTHEKPKPQTATEILQHVRELFS